MTNDVVSGFAVADPVNWAEGTPTIGSSVKLMAIEARGSGKEGGLSGQAGGAWVGVPGLSAQKPRELMMSVTVCGFVSALSSDACFAFGGATIWASADASCRAAAILVRGVRTGSAGLLSADLTGATVGAG